MSTRLPGLIRILRRSLSFFAGVVWLLLLAASLTAYLTATGKSLPILRAVTARLGRFVAGQRTDHLALNVRLMPDKGTLAGRATLTVRSTKDGRQRFYFLLNDGLRLSGVRVSGVHRGPQPASAYRLWLLTVIDVATPVAKDAAVHFTFDYKGRPGPRPFDVGENLINSRQVLLEVGSFWYPNDVQGFFTADVTVTLPATMTLIHNGPSPVQRQRGNLQEIHWTSVRPIGGLSLVAGPYALTELDRDGVRYRLYLPDSVHLDASRILNLMADAGGILSERYGPFGLKHTTMFISRDLARGFNDGSGLMGLSMQHIRAGDYGFAAIAHEIAHNWWGGTVAARWLSPGTGGQWIVEGFAEFSSLVAAEARYGRDALTHRLAAEFFDPARQAVLQNMSVLDNALVTPTRRATIYRKGAYVAFMLRGVLGEAVYFRALREFLNRFRYEQATDEDLQLVMQEVGERNLEPYFVDWVRSDRLADLSLDATKQGEMTVSNLGDARIRAPIDLWTFKQSGGKPIRSTVHVGETVALDPDTAYAVLDPQLAWVDLQRENNRYPRRRDPVYVAASAEGRTVVTEGEPFPWVRAGVSSFGDGGRMLHTWDFNRGMAAPPVWSPDGTRIVTSYSDAKGTLPAIVTLAATGTQHTVGRGKTPAAAADGTIYASTGDRIVRLGPNGTASTIVQKCGGLLQAPLPSPDGAQLLYIATSGAHLQVRITGRYGNGDRLLLSWDNDRLVYRWSPDGRRLYTVVGGTWDWQIWEIPLDAGAVNVLASGAAAIADLAVSPDGSQLAFTAAPALNYPANRRQLYIMNLGDHAVHNIDVPQADLTQLSWVDSGTLLVVATAARTGQPWMLPAQRTVKRVRLSDRSVEDFP
ncbi:MAG: LpqB family beta-propeller domain-containing protein [Candidatus Binatia bacterium]